MISSRSRTRHVEKGLSGRIRALIQRNAAEPASKRRLSSGLVQVIAFNNDSCTTSSASAGLRTRRIGHLPQEPVFSFN